MLSAKFASIFEPCRWFTVMPELELCFGVCASTNIDRPRRFFSFTSIFIRRSAAVELSVLECSHVTLSITTIFAPENTIKSAID